jgi:hypothetical protein
MEAIMNGIENRGAEALKRVKRITGRTLSPYGDEWTDMTWYPGALQRLGECGGIILGVSIHDEPLAERMALSLVSALDRLNTYGGKDEATGLRTWRVSLASDGTLCGFSILWNRLVTHERVMSAATNELKILWDQRAGTANRHDEQIRDLWVKQDFYTKVWGTRLHRHENVPTWDNDVWAPTHAMYAPDFNGGLLFHGLNHSPGAVLIGERTAWSIHT